MVIWHLTVHSTQYSPKYVAGPIILAYDMAYIPALPKLDQKERNCHSFIEKILILWVFISRSTQWLWNCHKVKYFKNDQNRSKNMS